MAKSRRDGENHRRMVDAVAAVLRTGEPTVFRFEAVCRHALRSTFCLSGRTWQFSDALAADVVGGALELIGAQRPPWAWGQPEYTAEDSAATRIGFTHCLNCGTRLEGEQFKFCGKDCGGRYRNEFEKSLEEIAADRVRNVAAREAYRKAAKALRCEACAVRFKPSYPGNIFCSRDCSSGRSVAEKMNGKHHPWMNGKTATGVAAANGVHVSLEKTATGEECSAPPNASRSITTPSSDASAPQPAPSSNANSVTNGSREPSARIGCSAPADARSAVTPPSSSAPRSAPG